VDTAPSRWVNMLGQHLMQNPTVSSNELPGSILTSGPPAAPPTLRGTSRLNLPGVWRLLPSCCEGGASELVVAVAAAACCCCCCCEFKTVLHQPSTTTFLNKHGLLTILTRSLQACTGVLEKTAMMLRSLLPAFMCTERSVGPCCRA